MPGDRLKVKIARLRREIGRLSAEQAQKLRQQTSAPVGRARELEERRAQILQDRVRRLDEMLAALQRGEPGAGSSGRTRKAVTSVGDS